jgi:putative transposase
VGWAIDRRCESILVNDALSMAARTRITPPSTVIHSNHGPQTGLNEPKHCDLAVDQVYARPLDEGVYLCSPAIMRTPPAKKRPELLAARGLFYYLYVILDIFSRYVLKWLAAANEDAESAKEIIEDAILTQGITRGTLTIHAHRVGAMRSGPVSELMVDLGVTRSHSRARVSNENPFSEAAFKTLKYCPTFPARFGCLEDARIITDEYCTYYNHEYRHSGIGLHTSASVHYDTHLAIREQRRATLSAANEVNPIRFRRLVRALHRSPSWCGSTNQNRRWPLTTRSDCVSHSNLTSSPREPC